jgi:hypothetical protein
MNRLLPARNLRQGLTATTAVLAASVTLTLALAAGVVLLALANQRLGDQIHGSQISACRTANQNRAEDIRLLNGIIALPAISAPQFQTAVLAARQRAQAARLHQDIAAANAPRDCTAVYSAG